jgi:Transposase DDE domain
MRRTGLTRTWAAKNFSMALTRENQTVNETFFQPLNPLVARSVHTLPCREVSDEEYVLLGVQRVLEGSESGRAFVQEHGSRQDRPPALANYFGSLHSARRGAVLQDVNHGVLAQANAKLHDRLADIPELARYEVFAADGHWHQAAAHDPRHEGIKVAVGHYYRLNLRTHTLRLLATGEGLHEHDLSALKRVKPKGLRQDVPKGRRVLMVYDKAAIDFGFWKRCRQECAVYFLSRAKDNQVLEWVANRDWDRTDARNQGVWADVRVLTRAGQPLRLVGFIDPLTDQPYEFLTNETDLPPVVLAELYRRRWEIEKVFDQLKNKLGQKKAWGSSLMAKQTQAGFLILTHNLLLIYEQWLERQHGVENEAENRRRQQRTAQVIEMAAKQGTRLSTLVTQARRATQRSVKFVRWLRHSLRNQLTEATAVLQLKLLYAKL